MEMSFDEALDRCMPLVKRLARKYAPMRSNSSVTFDDLVQEGKIALWKTLRRYNPEKGNLEAYARVWIEGAMKKCLSGARNIALPDHFERNLRKTDPEKLNQYDTLSLEMKIHTGDDGICTLSDTIPGSYGNPASLLARKEIYRAFKAAAAKLPKRQAQVIYLLYLRPAMPALTLDAVGKIMGISGEAARQLRNSALKNLRKSLRIVLDKPEEVNNEI
jgi:RNA polymerase sigma factor (sigma-70 family)